MIKTISHRSGIPFCFDFNHCPPTSRHYSCHCLIWSPNSWHHVALCILKTTVCKLFLYLSFAHLYEIPWKRKMDLSPNGSFPLRNPWGLVNWGGVKPLYWKLCFTLKSAKCAHVRTRTNFKVSLRLLRARVCPKTGCSEPKAHNIQVHTRDAFGPYQEQIQKKIQLGTRLLQRPNKQIMAVCEGCR